jgi:hypothetical protein
MNDGMGNWNKLYMPGKETPMSLLRFSPFDEDAKATEVKSVYPKAKARKKRRQVSAAEAAQAMLNGRR